VAWADAAADESRDRLAAGGVIVGDLPGRGLLRTSVGAWNDDSDSERLLAASAADRRSSRSRTRVRFEFQRRWPIKRPKVAACHQCRSLAAA
jgi:hypothetical protein